MKTIVLHFLRNPYTGVIKRSVCNTSLFLPFVSFYSNSMSKVLLIEDDDGIITPFTLHRAIWLWYRNLQRRWRCAHIFHVEKPDIIILDINLPGKMELKSVEKSGEEWNSDHCPLSTWKWRWQSHTSGTRADDSLAVYPSHFLLVNSWPVLVPLSNDQNSEKKQQKQQKFSNSENSKLMEKIILFSWMVKDVRLTKTEFSILEYFVKNTKNVIKRDALMKDIIGYDNYLYDRTIDTHVKNICKKLDGAIDIETVRGVGYRVKSL